MSGKRAVAATMSAVPVPCSVYKLYDANDCLLYVGITNNWKSRRHSHVHEKPWFSDVAREEIEHFHSQFVAAEREKLLILTERPRYNRRKSRFIPSYGRQRPRTMHVHLCESCGLSFERRSLRARYCCRTCYALGKRKDVPCVCKFCSVSFDRSPSILKRGGGQYCSLECRNQGYRNDATDFWSRVDKHGDGCWLWTGQKNHSGHGKCSFRGKQTGTHRISYELAYGPIPAGKQVCHNCPDGDNPLCVNPAHLFLGTFKQNMDDKLKKGRQAKGEQCHRSKLRASDVLEIRRVIAAKEATRKALAARFSVSKGTIDDIVIRRTWQHLTDETASSVTRPVQIDLA